MSPGTGSNDIEEKIKKLAHNGNVKKCAQLGREKMCKRIEKI